MSGSSQTGSVPPDDVPVVIPELPHPSGLSVPTGQGPSFVATLQDELSLPLLGDDEHQTTTTTEYGSEEQGSKNAAVGVEEVEDPKDRTLSAGGSPTVTCRVCEHQIPYDSRSMQHVVRCPSCNEATPIRAAPTGKKFVRCPCNCLLICKISSNRIACPRPNCGRVIILKPTSTAGTAIPAPTGTARVQCVFCEEVFMLNTLAQQVAYCPHCQQRSSIGANYVRTRSFAYGFVALLSLMSLVFLVVSTWSDFNNNHWIILIYLGILLFTLFASIRCRRYLTMRISKVLGPL